MGRRRHSKEGNGINARHSTCEAYLALDGIGLDPVRFGWLTGSGLRWRQFGSTNCCIVRYVRNGWVAPLPSGKRLPSPMVDFDWIACFYDTE